MTKYSLVQTSRTTFALVALRPDGEMGHLIAEGTRAEMEAQLELTLRGEPTEILGMNESGLEFERDE